MTDTELDAARRQFPSAERSIHLDHASVGPISQRVADAMQRNASEHAGHGFNPLWRNDVEEVRSRVARFIGSTPDQIAFVQNTSHGLSIAANGIAWRTGDNVVIPEHEFTSNYYPWLNLADRGVELRTVDAPQGHATLEALAAAIDARTRAVTVSAVQYSNGHRYDLAAIRQLCDDTGTLLVVDGTQAVGAMAIDVERCGVDVLAVSSHKWMLGPPGIGFAHFSQRALGQIRPTVLGWLSVTEPFEFHRRIDLPATAAKFEPGTENIIGILGLGAAISLFHELGTTWVEQRVLELTDRIGTAASARGFDLSSSEDRARRSGIVIVSRPDQDPQPVFERLTAAGVKCAIRAGGIRFSPHCYNTDDEIDAAMEALH